MLLYFLWGFLFPFSGKCIDEASFNLGIGVGLAFLIANSKNEFHKLKELQTQMEMLLGDIKNEMQRKDMICPNSKNNLASNSNGSKCTEDHLDVQSHGSSDCLVMELSTMECGQFSKSDLTEGSAKGVGMDQLEAELEAELERLQLKLDAENTSELRRKQCVKVCRHINFFSPSSHFIMHLLTRFFCFWLKDQSSIGKKKKKRKQ